VRRLVKRLLRHALLGAALAVALLALPGAALGIPPFLHAEVSAPGNTAPSGWYNVPVTLAFSAITWDDPLMNGTYNIAAITYTRNGGPSVAVVPTCTLTLCEDGEYLITATGTWGGRAYPWPVNIDRTAPRSTSNAKVAYVGAAKIGISVEDTGCGVGAIRYALDSAPDATLTVAAAQPAGAIVAGVGAHQLWWSAVDAAGNAERPWHHVAFVVSPAVLWLGSPSVRVRGSRVALVGRISGLDHATTIRLALERRVGSHWRVAGSYPLRIKAAATSWSTNRIFTRAGRYRVRAVDASGARSGLVYFRR
jgi:hypothetical protein